MARYDLSVVTGQSLSFGGSGGAAVTTTAPYPANVLSVDAAGAFVPLPVSTATQYPSVSLGIRAYEYARDTLVDPAYRGVFYWGGRDDTAYAGIKKGTPPYATALTRTQQARDTASAAGDTLTARAVHLIHGESDQLGGVTRDAYAGYITELLTDYGADLKAVTGQTSDLVLLTSQTASWDKYVGTYPRTGLGQLDAARAHPRIHMVGPQYQFPYVADGIHLTAVGYYKLGELHGKVHSRIVQAGLPWQPVAPRSITIAGAVITARYHVPVAPLVFDTTTIAAQPHMGFDFRDDAASAVIASVAITAPDTVTVTLTAPPTGANPRLTYGAIGGRLGNLRDSDPTVSAYDGGTLANWSVHSDDPVPYTDTGDLLTARMGGATRSILRVRLNGLDRTIQTARVIG